MDEWRRWILRAERPWPCPLQIQNIFTRRISFPNFWWAPAQCFGNLQVSKVKTQKTPEFLTNKKHYSVFNSNPAMFHSSMKLWPTATAHHSYFGSQFRSAALHHSDPSDHCELSFSQAFFKATGANLAAADTLQPKWIQLKPTAYFHRDLWKSCHSPVRKFH